MPLFAEILADLAKTVAAMPLADADHRIALRGAAEALRRALDSAAGDRQAGTDKSGECTPKEQNDIANLTPEEEVLVLHVLE